MKSGIKILAGLALLGTSAAAFAHPGHGESSLTHLATNADHLVALLVVVLWLAQVGWLLRNHLLAGIVAGLPMVAVGAWLLQSAAI